MTPDEYKEWAINNYDTYIQKIEATKKRLQRKLKSNDFNNRVDRVKRMIDKLEATETISSRVKRAFDSAIEKIKSFVSKKGSRADTSVDSGSGLSGTGTGTGDGGPRTVTSTDDDPSDNNGDDWGEGVTSVFD